jgi:hypothetical protein
MFNCVPLPSIHNFKYFTTCNECKEEVEVRTHIKVVFHKAKPYCWKCRCKLISVWANEEEENSLNRIYRAKGK